MGETMAAMNASWVKHPGFYIKEEMEERGLLQRDLAFILGCSEQALNRILSGKGGITAEMAKALGDAFDVSPEFFANLQQAHDLAKANPPDPGVAARSKMQGIFPVREMIKREWIRPDHATLEQQLVLFFDAKSYDQIPYLRHAAKKGDSYEQREIQPEQLAWLYRVRQIAKSISVPKYSENKLRSALEKLEPLLQAPEEVRHVPRLLMECGVRFIIVEKLVRAKIDGVAFWVDDSPVIGMSIMRDRIDNFWFCLRHEIEHVLRGHGKEKEGEMIDADLEQQAMLQQSEEERVANEAASDFCIPMGKFNDFWSRKKPFFSEKDVIAFAILNNRHPGLVVGQIRKRSEKWNYLTRYLPKIRQYVLTGGAIYDGWGQVVPVSL